MLGSDRFQFETPNVIDPGDLPPNQPSRGSRGNANSNRAAAASSRQDISFSPDRSPTSSTHSASSSSSDNSSNGEGNIKAVEEYRHDRTSSARLLNDINDLELSPRGVVAPGSGATRANGGGGGYSDNNTESSARRLSCEYGDDIDDEDFDDDDHDAIAASLPSVEEARSYAASLLDNAEKKYRSSSNMLGSGGSSKQSLGLDRTVPIHSGESSFSMSALSQHFQLDGNNNNNKSNGNGNNNNNSRRNMMNRRSSSKHLVLRRVSVLVAKIFLVVILALTAVLIVVALVNSKSKSRSNSNGNPSLVDDASSATFGNNNGGGNNFPATSPTEFMTRLDSVVNFLSAGEITSIHELTTPGSPQYLAAHWMADVDPLQYDVPSHVDDDPDLFVQRYVLATFYYAMQGSGSAGADGNESSGSSNNGWTDPLKFLSAEHECAWFEREQVVGFIDEAYAIGVSCSYPALKVENLFIPSNNLKGTLPSELRHLPDLTMLALPMNQIQGPIPEDLQFLSKLDYLDLKYNALDGTVPEFIANIVTLEVLGLSNNNLSGPIPGEWSELSKLKTLALDDNKNLDGTLGFANHLFHLEFFYVNGNQFTGSIDDNFLAAATQLKEVDISNNALTSTEFPTHLLQHPTLSVLDMAGNEGLEGALPDTLPNVNEYLEFLSLRDNRWTGSITATNLPMLTALKHLDLQGSGLSGALPDEMKQLTQLTYLFLGHNAFTVPTMPSLIIHLTQLRELSMPNISMQLGIPDWLAQLQDLVLLDLSENAMTGKVPIELFQLPHLRFLLLNNNNLSGALPTSLPNLPNLMILSMHKNQITGDMNEVCSQTPAMQLLGTDCSSNVQCSDECCPTCCPPEEDLCFVENIPHFLTWYDGMWEFGYKRAPFSYDPAILDESHYFSTLQDVSNINENNFTMPTTTPP